MCFILFEALWPVLAFIAANVWFFAGYLGKGNSFKKPLSAAAEKEYLDKMKSGDANAKNILIERNMRLVAHIVKKYSGCGYENDDLISIGTIGLIKGVASFNTEKGSRLATYLAKCIDNEILMHIRRNKKFQNEVSMNDTIGSDRDGNEITLMDVLVDEDGNVYDKVALSSQIDELHHNIKNVLDEREIYILTTRFGLGGIPTRTQNDIADELGISRSYVSRIEKKAIKKLRAHM